MFIGAYGQWFHVACSTVCRKDATLSLPLRVVWSICWRWTKVRCCEWNVFCCVRPVWYFCFSHNHQPHRMQGSGGKNNKQTKCSLVFSVSPDISVRQRKDTLSTKALLWAVIISTDKSGRWTLCATAKVRHPPSFESIILTSHLTISVRFNSYTRFRMTYTFAHSVLPFPCRSTHESSPCHLSRHWWGRSNVSYYI